MRHLCDEESPAKPLQQNWLLRMAILQGLALEIKISALVSKSQPKKKLGLDIWDGRKRACLKTDTRVSKRAF